MKSQDNQISNYIESRLTRVETVIEHINQNLKEIKENQKKTDEKLDNLAIRMDEKLDNLGTRINNLLYWMLGSILLPAGSASFIYILKSLHFIN